MRGPQTLQIGRARRLRRTRTDAEMKLWQKLRARQIERHKFVRQEPVGPYVVDFICRERQLVIEVDGGQHAESGSDAVRDKWFAHHGYRILRFWNHDVLQNVDGVLQVIASTVAEATPHPDR